MVGRFMNLSAHFTLDEFCASETAARKGINNSLPLALYDNAKRTAAVLERIRSHLKAPVYLSSGYRSLYLNRELGSKDTSDHTKALAADFRAPAFGNPLDICRALVPVMDAIGIGQIIYEHTWVHIGVPVPDKLLNRILTVQGRDYIVGISGANP